MSAALSLANTHSLGGESDALLLPFPSYPGHSEQPGFLRRTKVPVKGRQHAHRHRQTDRAPLSPLPPGHPQPGLRARIRPARPRRGAAAAMSCPERGPRGRGATRGRPAPLPGASGGLRGPQRPPCPAPHPARAPPSCPAPPRPWPRCRSAPEAAAPRFRRLASAAHRPPRPAPVREAEKFPVIIFTGFLHCTFCEHGLRAVISTVTPVQQSEHE